MENKIIENKNCRACEENEQAIARVAVALPDMDDDTVLIPRGEYNTLISDHTILSVVKKLVNTAGGPYGDFDTLRAVLQACDETGDCAE